MSQAVHRRRLSPAYDYVRLAITPACVDAITLRKSIQDALGQSFGIVSSHTYLDVLWIDELGEELVIRIGQRYAYLNCILTFPSSRFAHPNCVLITSDTEKLLAAIAAATAVPRLSYVKRSTFLPSLNCVNPTF